MRAIAGHSPNNTGENRSRQTARHFLSATYSRRHDRLDSSIITRGFSPQLPEQRLLTLAMSALGLATTIDGDCGYGVFPRLPLSYGLP